MAIQFTEYPIKTATGTARVKTAIDPENPGFAPQIVDKNNTVLYQWNPTNNKFEPLGSGNDILPSGSGFGTTETFGSLLNQNSDVFTRNTTTVINKLPDNQKSLFQSSNTFQPYTTFAQGQQAASTGGAGSGTPGLDPLTVQDVRTSITGSDDSISVENSLKGVNLVYPTAIRTNKQDRIKFTAKKVTGRTTNITATADFSLGTRETQTLGSVTLPIQPSITDSNGVDWGGANLNPIQAYAASLSLDIAAAGGNITGDVARALNQAATEFKDNLGDYSKAIQIYFAQEAVGAQGLLSRTSGAILNPNLELLFNGPTLRPFNFTFRLSPRDKDEAKEVKAIINFFKKAMAVQTAKTEVFLKAPNIFAIQYETGDTGKPHKSLNRIKDCALLGCDIDYTPDGSYMTFNNEETGYPMTSYQMTLRFSELDPIYSSDYASFGEGEIGF
jgi:hypothetical protein